MQGKNKVPGSEKFTEDQSARGKKESYGKVSSEPAAAAVGGTSSIGMFHLLLGLMPWCAVCRVLPTFVHRGLFPF